MKTIILKNKSKIKHFHDLLTGKEDSIEHLARIEKAVAIFKKASKMPL